MYHLTKGVVAPMGYESAPAHQLTLEGRARLSVTGVENVERFDETGIVLATAAGLLVISGEELHIDRLSIDGGELLVEGRVDSLSYEETESRGGLLQRLFG